MTEQLDRLEAWYRDHARPFVEAHQATKLEELDKSLERIRELVVREAADVTLCFLGRSGVGKSTLINALVAGTEVVLPAGGIGPLTASAMQVRFGEAKAFEAQYHGPQLLGRVLFAMEQHHQREVKAQEAHDLADLIDVTAEPEMALAEEDEAGGEVSRIAAFRNQAQLMVRGRQDAQTDVPYLLDALRFVLGREPRWGVVIEPEDSERLKRLRVLMSSPARRSYRTSISTAPESFDKDLFDHAAGSLAPLIQELRISWPSDLLRDGLVLVDLPGVGVATDVYKSVTRHWVGRNARAVVLVVDRSGVTVDDARLLKASEFLTRLMFSADERSDDPVALAIAVTQLDNVAQEHHHRDPTKKRAQHLADAFEVATTVMRSQFDQHLRATWQDGDGLLEKAKAEIITNLVTSLNVYPVSAVEFRRFLEQDEEAPPFVKSAEASGIPTMAAGIRAIHRDVKQRAKTAREDAVDVHVGQVVSLARLVEAQWQDEQRTVEEVEKLRSELEGVLAPLRKEFLGRQGAFREFLRMTVPEQIRAGVIEARSAADKSIERYLRSLSTAHWATLRASVRREGTFLGSRHINLPDDFAQMFVEPLAEVWGRTIIQSIKKRTREFAGDCIRQVETVVSWCRTQEARVQPVLVEALLETIKADLKQIDLIGKNAVQELRDEVKTQLASAIEQPIRQECRQFVRRGDDFGRGVKVRILGMFDELKTKAVDAAERPASALLTRSFRKVESELGNVLDHYKNPLDQASEAILASHSERLRRSDAQRRKGVLADAARVLAEAPNVRPTSGPV